VLDDLGLFAPERVVAEDPFQDVDRQRREWQHPPIVRVAADAAAPDGPESLRATTSWPD
jgi:hypothetical protein